MRGENQAVDETEVDALMRIKIEVTAEDIQQGKHSSPCACPVACAIRRTTGAYVGVFGDYIDYCDPRTNEDYVITPPLKVERFIHRFDGGKKVQPFSFTLVVPK